jgi:hypothetical protein
LPLSSLAIAESSHVGSAWIGRPAIRLLRWSERPRETEAPFTSPERQAAAEADHFYR